MRVQCVCARASGRIERRQVDAHACACVYAVLRACVAVSACMRVRERAAHVRALKAVVWVGINIPIF